MKPNMLPEILECLHFYFEDYPNVEVDCLLYLSGLMDDSKQVRQLSLAAISALSDMERCANCGEPLQYYHYKEPHPELEGCPMEDMCVLICPTCDLKGGKLID